MKHFLYRVIILFSILISIFILLDFINKDTFEANDYLAGIIEKHNRINSIQNAKIILAGGSNLAFGVNSEQIENEMNIPVVNLGLHAGLGLRFILNELKFTAEPDDIVILSIEYFLPLDGDYELKKIVSTYYSEVDNFYNVNPKQFIKSNIEKARKNLKSVTSSNKHTTKKIDSVYNRKAFNHFGDVISHLSKKKRKKLNGSRAFDYQYWEGIHELNEFNKYAQQNNIKVFFIYPNYPTSEFDLNSRVIKKYTNDIESDLDIKVINKPEDFVFDDSLFFDTIYHLNKEGRQKRTKMLINILQQNVYN